MTMRLTTREITVFAMLGAVMYASKLLMELIPNVHLLGVLVVAFTVVYRKKALYPIYIYVLLNGIFCGFAAWWVPYLYVWTVLCGHASSAKDAQSDSARGIYGCLLGSRLFVRNPVCPGAGSPVRVKPGGNGWLDHCGPSMGLYTRCQ